MIGRKRGEAKEDFFAANPIMETSGDQHIISSLSTAQHSTTTRGQHIAEVNSAIGSNNPDILCGSSNPNSATNQHGHGSSNPKRGTHIGSSNPERTINTGASNPDMTTSTSINGPSNPAQSADINGSDVSERGGSNNSEYNSRGSSTKSFQKGSSSTDSLKCLYTNADSLMNKRGELDTRIESVKPDIVAVTEVLPKSKGDDILMVELELDGYDCFFNRSPANGRGVCLYTKKWLKATQNDDLTNHAFRESIWCDIKLQNNDNLLVGCVYRSPSTSNDNNELLLDIIKCASNKNNSHLMIVGDFNYREAN